MTEKRQITEATINDSFHAISAYFGYDAENYADEIAELLQLWNDQGFVEIYQTDADRAYGLLKDSSENKKGNTAPYYIGLYHARILKSGNDPLIVVKFHTNENGENVDMRFMIHHEEFFGTKKVKNDSKALRAMWLEIDAQIKEGDNI